MKSRSHLPPALVRAPALLCDSEAEAAETAHWVGLVEVEGAPAAGITSPALCVFLWGIMESASAISKLPDSSLPASTPAFEGHRFCGFQFSLQFPPDLSYAETYRFVPKKTDCVGIAIHAQNMVSEVTSCLSRKLSTNMSPDPVIFMEGYQEGRPRSPCRGSGRSQGDRRLAEPPQGGSYRHCILGSRRSPAHSGHIASL